MGHDREKKLKVCCGYKTKGYGTIQTDGDGFIYIGQVKTLAALVRVAAIMSKKSTPEEVLEEMVNIFSYHLWVYKYNENHDEAGRFASGDGGGAAQASSLAAMVGSSGGFTYSPISGSPTEGLALSIFPNESKSVDAATITGKDISDYMDAHSELLKDPSNYVGAWHDTQAGRVALDISKVLPASAHDQAVALSTQFGQRAYWDIGNSQEIRVVDDAHAQGAASDTTPHEQKAAKPKVILHAMLSGKESPQVLDALAQKIRDAQKLHDSLTNPKQSS